MRCSFCEHDIPTGTGKIYATKEGATRYFCSRKCEKNLLVLKRKPQRVRWTTRYREEKRIRLHGKEEKKTEKTEERVTKKKTTKKERRVAKHEKRKKLKEDKVRRRDEKAKAPKAEKAAEQKAEAKVEETKKTEAPATEAPQASVAEETKE